MAVDTEGIFDIMKDKMDDFVEIISNRRWQLMMVTLLAIFTLLGYWGYNKFYKPTVDPPYVENKEYLKGDIRGNSGIELLYFYTDWCPYCKKTEPIWNEFKASSLFQKEVYNESQWAGITDGTYKGTPVTFSNINCDENPKLADQYNIKGYPTIKLVKGNQVIEYDAQPTIPTLKQFIPHPFDFEVYS